MGSALAIVHTRAGLHTALLGTKFDTATIDACRAGKAHPALGIALPAGIDCRRIDGWGAVLQNTDRVVLGVSSDGLADVAQDIAKLAGPRADWVIATKGWDPDTLRTPSEVAAACGVASERIVVLGGPALAPELVAGAPTAMVCASTDREAAERVADTLAAGGVTASATDDVTGSEIAAAYKNVTAIAVGMAEGLSERKAEHVYVHRFANARSAVFAQGLRDMCALAGARGGRVETIVGLAGAGDLYVTCLGGRNGTFGRLLGSGQTPAQAQTTIGSTVEGVPNTSAALAIGDEHGVDLWTARAVDAVLKGNASPEEAIADLVAATG
jgi:glycerol-3-phosphate dehydrogenase (NAD(P)+)